jgi:ABC-type cobalamin/Fe3+-siderophores transport system ATPase subunit
MTIEKRLNQRIKEELIALEQSVENIKDTLTDTVFLSDKALKDLPHASILKEIKLKLEELTTNTEAIVNQWWTSFSLTQDQIKTLSDSLRSEIQSTEEALEKTFKDLPSSEGKRGSEIGHEFQQLLKQIEYIKPKKKSIEAHQRLVSELNQQRKALLSELSECRADRTAQFNRSLKKLNKQLDGKLKLSIKPEADKKPVVDFLLKCNLENVAQARLAWINEADDFSTVRLAELIQQGNNALSQSNWGITPTVVNALIKMNLSHVMQLQELELPDIIEIQLNVAHSGEEKFRLLEKLSRGQQCTAILHLLLLKNSDPLIMDQPEDNLDNAFIADRIVAELRNEKINRQFIFATHNANIPVFGDAEWIGIFESSDDQASMPKEAQGGIDVETIREMSANILEGGKTAFNQRKLKYGY